MVVRKRLDIDIPGPAFVTTTVKGWCQVFAQESVADIVLNQLSETARFCHATIIAYCLMPSHLHVIINLTNIKDLSDVVGSFKSLSSRRVKSLVRHSFKDEFSSDRPFQLWKARFNDFIIRDLNQLRVKIGYVHDNPVRARLADAATDWKYSSARDWILDQKGPIEIDKTVMV